MASMIKTLAGTARSCLTLSEEQNELALDRRTNIFNAKDFIKSLVFAFGQRGTDRIFSSKEAIFLIFNVLDCINRCEYRAFCKKTSLSSGESSGLHFV